MKHLSLLYIGLSVILYSQFSYGLDEVIYKEFVVIGIEIESLEPDEGVEIDDQDGDKNTRSFIALKSMPFGNYSTFLLHGIIFQ